MLGNIVSDYNKCNKLGHIDLGILLCSASRSWVQCCGIWHHALIAGIILKFKATLAQNMSNIYDSPTIVNRSQTPSKTTLPNWQCCCCPSTMFGIWRSIWWFRQIAFASNEIAFTATGLENAFYRLVDQRQVFPEAIRALWIGFGAVHGCFAKIQINPITTRSPSSDVFLHKFAAYSERNRNS